MYLDPGASGLEKLTIHRMCSVKNGVVPLVACCDNVLQGTKSNTVGTRYYSTLGATSTLIICDSRGLSAGDDAYED